MGVFGAPLASPGPTFASVLILLGALELPLGELWAPVVPFGMPLVPVAGLWAPFGYPGTYGACLKFIKITYDYRREALQFDIKTYDYRREG